MQPSTLLVTHSLDARAIRAVCAAATGRARRALLVVGPGARHAAPHRFVELALSESDDLVALADQIYDRVLLHEFADQTQLPSPLVRDIFSRPVRWLRHVDELGRRRPYRPFAGQVGRARVLNVFPGAPVPLDKGSNQRVFNLTWHLNRVGIATDLLITTGSRRSLPRLRDLLTAIAPTIHTYHNDKPALPLRQRLRRELERGYRLLHGRWRRAPDLFVDRLATRASRSGKRRLGELVAGGQYHAVIVNFAWMTGLVDAARARAPATVRWLCDTHDVQFVRGASQSRGEVRLALDQAAEQASELAQLRRYDTVLAISAADQSELDRHLEPGRALLVPSGFDYAFRPLAAALARPPFRFGFIGRDMRPNLMALERLIGDWWPAITRRSPGSRLLVAGTLCARRDVQLLARSQPGIELVGFVPTLASFYQRFDIALNPVVVHGGLNFKSVEALAAGRLLITTALGAACLGADPPVEIADRGAEVAERVAGFAAAPEELDRRRRHAQAWCVEHFFDDRAYRNLTELLRG